MNIPPPLPRLLVLLALTCSPSLHAFSARLRPNCGLAPSASLWHRPRTHLQRQPPVRTADAPTVDSPPVWGSRHDHGLDSSAGLLTQPRTPLRPQAPAPTTNWPPAPASRPNQSLTSSAGLLLQTADWPPAPASSAPLLPQPQTRLQD